MEVIVSHINQLVISGRLTADPLARDGGNVCKLSLASNRQFQRQGEWQNDVLFIDATAFSFNASKCISTLVKGDEVTITGRLELNTWEAQDGSKRREHRIVINTIESPAFSKAYARVPKEAREGFEAAVTTAVADPEAEAFVAVAPSTDDDIPF
jgi:single-strand DNA-binding protein